jgi:hypothetical protein
MLELINAIPENVGWAIVGFMTCILCGQIICLGKCLYLMWKERREDDEEE